MARVEIDEDELRYLRQQADLTRCLRMDRACALAGQLALADRVEWTIAVVTERCPDDQRPRTPHRLAEDAWRLLDAVEAEAANRARGGMTT